MPVSQKPAWLKKRLPPAAKVHNLKKRLRERKLHTVCESASCPNIHECFAKPTATFMILGNVCTRECAFCGVKKGEPLPVDVEEPARVARMAKELRLKHVVITSVTRDDLPDGGASQFAKTISLLRESNRATIEVLTPDFFSDLEPRPDIFNHNLETVPRLYPEVRPQADFHKSLALLDQTKKRNPNLMTKSGIMLGFGETYDEVIEVMKKLIEVECDILTIGQYLQPSKHLHPVVEYVHPEQFDQYKEIGEKMGFLHVASAPFVRSSFNADDVFKLPVESGLKK